MKGLKYCSHELVARMDTDDIAMPERFEKQFGLYLRNYPDIDVLGCVVMDLVRLKYRNHNDCKKVAGNYPDDNKTVRKRR